ncbi:MAG: tRNA (adenosine(37)-N6)-dimethylallyltransferase MiaA [Deltaproteobacteria bacterium]|nr:tRNA (adenosine(37)-N6)-dimethylallyltransferase MiaA [Deltaproteobacteria bacterium]
MYTQKRPKAIVIAGPTASGKSLLSVDLALALKGEIINADSMQVYRGMDIGTAKPTIEERKGITHHLLDVVDPDEEFNTALYRSLALPMVSDICSRGKTCFVVGGTGLYIKGLIKGLFDCPRTDIKIRETLNKECKEMGSEFLHARLRKLDPESACTIHPNDRMRIIRALEIIILTDSRPSDLKKSHGFNEDNLKALKLCLNVDREELYSRINRRTRAMVESGLPEETENLLKKGYSPGLKAMKSIGYRHMIKYLRGEWSIEETVYRLQMDTRRYAKRQLTWFRSDPEFIWLEPQDFDAFLEKTSKFLIETS